jgi:DNA-binding NarL/FixJ family response regulator
VNELPLNIILADDHYVVRHGLAALLQMNGRYRVICEASNGEEAIQCAANHPADIIIIDLSMPRLNGLEAIRRLRQNHATLKILVLSMYDDEEFVIQALRDGANGFILKHSMDDELFQALAALAENQPYTSASINLDRLNGQAARTAAKLTAREREVLQLIAEGYTTNEIADLMSISPHTANRHRANVMQKMGVHNQIELVRDAVKRGLIILKRPLKEIEDPT